MSKRPDPEMDFGFHAVVPRIVRTGHKKLTATQKWLYVCLKDLCGDRGICFRTLEKLSEETDISEAMLSKSIYLLRDEGLINAEKKRRSSGGKPIWHLSIIDIWGANAKAHPTKRSQKEYSHNEDTPPSGQENVHHMNENPKEYSHSEREYSQNADRGNNTRSNNITEGEGEGNRDQSTQDNSSSSADVGDETTENVEEKELLSSVVEEIKLTLTPTLITLILDCHHKYPSKDKVPGFDIVAAARESRQYYDANKKGKVMTASWFERNLAQKIEFYEKDLKKALPVERKDGIGVSGLPIVRATEGERAVVVPQIPVVQSSFHKPFDASRFRNITIQA